MCAGGSKNAASRCVTKKGAKTEAHVNDDQSGKMDSSDQLQQLRGVDKLPPVDTPEASNISAAR